MKYFFAAIITLFSLLNSSAENQSQRIKIMSYNIRNGMGINDVKNLQRTADVITTINPDIVALQELDSVTMRSGKHDLLAELATATSMHGSYCRAISYDGGAYGIGLLSKDKPLNVRRLSLPGTEEKRALLIAEFDKYVVFATHFSLTPQDQSASIELISGYAKQYTKPVFIAGDLNFEPTSPQYKELIKSFKILSNPKSATYPADKPTQCIDYIGAFKGADTYATTENSIVVAAAEQSDHRPITVQVNFGSILRTNPYLQNPTNSGITVLWQTNTPCESWVEWGEDSTKLTRSHTLIAGQVISNNKLNKIRLTDIQGGKRYHYRIVSREIISYGAYSKTFGGTYRSPMYEFMLPSEKESDFTALIFNDLHQQKATIDALMKVVGNQSYDFVLFNGDCVDDPSSEAQAINVISHFNDAVGSTDKPVIFMRGNHEIRGAFSMGFTTLFDYVGGQSYGAMNWGDTRMVMLDCGEDKPDAHSVYYGLNDFEGFRNDQLAFLKQEHTSTEFRKASKRILIHHIPIWGLEESYNPGLTIWGNEISKQPYSFVVNAHTHQAALHEADSKWGNKIPVIIGGGPSLKSATVMFMRKSGDKLTIEAFNVKGEKIFEIKGR